MSHWCKHHPRYEAKRTPKALCGDCWQLYFLRHPENKPHFIDTYRDLDKLRAHVLKP